MIQKNILSIHPQNPPVDCSRTFGIFVGVGSFVLVGDGVKVGDIMTVGVFDGKGVLVGRGVFVGVGGRGVDVHVGSGRGVLVGPVYTGCCSVTADSTDPPP